MRKSLLFIFAVFFLQACTIHRKLEIEQSFSCIPESFSESVDTEISWNSDWWKEFNDPGLHELMARSLSCNLDIKQAWHRLSQAEATLRIAQAGFSPTLDINAGLKRVYAEGGDDISLSRYHATGTLGYEVDLWKRIANTVHSASAAVEVSSEDLEETALVLTGSISDLWFTVIEQQRLVDLLEEQKALSQTLLELVELRFSVGESNALDVYQQRSQLAATQLQGPIIEATLKTSLQQLDVLSGDIPGKLEVSERQFPPLPPFPKIGNPIQLFASRPDLRAAEQRLISADAATAAALADCYPKLSIALSYDFSATDWSQIFTQLVRSVGANLVQPFFDGKKRGAEVDRNKAIVCEYLSAYELSFLQALQEVESAIIEEKEEVELLSRIREQIMLATASLNEARLRYSFGASDYLPIIAAVESLQILQRREINEEKNLLVIRSRLYRALGGGSCHEEEEKNDA
jgi:multidrug efflux system outer membrane protein